MRWIGQFKYGDADSIEYRKRIIDTFVNAVFLFDDKLVITYNFKGGTETITLKDIEAAYGSDLKAVSPPKACKSKKSTHCNNLIYKNPSRVNISIHSGGILSKCILSVLSGAGIPLTIS